MRGLLATAFASVIVYGCASAGSTPPGASLDDAAKGGDAGKLHDAANGEPLDSPSTHHDAAAATPDASPDAFVSHMPDADTDGALCTANDQCTNSGECCVTLGGPEGFCAPGTKIGSTCVPDTSRRN